MKKIMILITLLISCNAYAAKDTQIQNTTQPAIATTTNNQKKQSCNSDWFAKGMQFIPLSVTLATTAWLAVNDKIAPHTWFIANIFFFSIRPKGKNYWSSED